MELQLKITGYVLMLLAIIHVAFPKYFEWEKEFTGLSLINRQMMYIHTFFIGLAVFLSGLLSVSSAEDLLHTPIGKRIAFGLFIFWFARLLIQFFGYSSELWKGKRFETSMHILFSMLWIYVSAVYFLVWNT